MSMCNSPTLNIATTINSISENIPTYTILIIGAITFSKFAASSTLIEKYKNCGG